VSHSVSSRPSGRCVVLCFLIFSNSYTGRSTIDLHRVLVACCEDLPWWAAHRGVSCTFGEKGAADWEPSWGHLRCHPEQRTERRRGRRRDDIMWICESTDGQTAQPVSELGLMFYLDRLTNEEWISPLGPGCPGGTKQMLTKERMLFDPLRSPQLRFSECDLLLDS